MIEHRVEEVELHCIYIENIPVKVRKDLNDENFECLWVVLRPIWLPRAISRIAVACVYIPPSISHDDLNSFYEYFFLLLRYP